MTRPVKPRRVRKGDLQQAFDEGLSRFTRAIATELIKKKLRRKGFESNHVLLSKLVDFVLADDQGEFQWKGPDEFKLLITDEDSTDLDCVIQAHLNEIPALVDKIASDTAHSLLKELKQNWSEQQVWTAKQSAGFRWRLEERWGEALNYLRMLLTISREIGERVYVSNKKSKAKRNRNRRDLLSRLHARACQVAAEIITLLENGYADGAMARWRTLYESPSRKG